MQDSVKNIEMFCSFYADFATFTETSLRGKSQTQITKVHDTNHVANFMICVGDFPPGKVSAKVGVMEFGLKDALQDFCCVYVSYGVFTRSTKHRANIELAQAGLLEPRPLA